VIGALPQHLANSHGIPGLAEMYIDIGVQSRLAAEEVGIEVGSPVAYASVFEIMNGRIASKAMDDRGGCTLLLQLAERIVADEVPADVFLVFAVQEETALRGAVPAIYEIQPDYAIGVDATLAFDTPDLNDGQTEVCLGGGVVFKVLDHIRGSGLGFISHPGLRRHLEQLAHEHEIPFQREVVTGLSTAATPLPYVRSGLPVAGVSFPLRYSHSPVEVADTTDLENTLALLELAVQHPWELS
jgi:putative aminopeptidase FrvX